MLPNLRARAAQRYKEQEGQYKHTKATDGAARKQALLKSPADLKEAADTKCQHCPKTYRDTIIFASLVLIDGRNVSQHLNMAPRYHLNGNFSCADCMLQRQEFGLFVYFNAIYKEHTPDVLESSLMRIYYPEEEQGVLRPGKGLQKFCLKHLDIFYSILGCTAQKICASQEDPKLLSAFLYTWNTAREAVLSKSENDQLPSSEHDVKLLEILTRYTSNLRTCLSDETSFKRVEDLEKKLDPRVLVWIQQSAALTGQQNRQLAPHFPSRAAALVTQTLFPSGKLPPVDVQIVRTDLVRDFLTRATRHFSSLNLRSFNGRDQLARHVLKTFQQSSLSVLRGMTFICDLVDKYQHAFKEERRVTKPTLGFLRTLRSSLVGVQDLRTLLCVNGLAQLTDLDVAEMLLEASEAQDGQTVSAAALDLAPSATSRYPTLDRIINENKRAKQEQDKSTKVTKNFLEQKKKELKEPDLRDALGVVSLDTQTFVALVNNDIKNKSIELLRQKIDVAKKSCPPAVVQLYTEEVELAGHEFGQGMHKNRLELIQALAEHPSASLLEVILLAQAMPFAPKKFLKILWRLGPQDSELSCALGLSKSRDDHARSMLPRKLSKYHFGINNTVQHAEEFKREEHENNYTSPEEGLKRARERRLALQAAEQKLLERALEECPVCFCVLSTNPHYRLPCSKPPQAPHMLCESCMRQLETKRCTLCRKGFQVDQLRLIKAKGQFTEGTVVLIKGLTKKPVYNGKRAVVKFFDSTKMRYGITLQTEEGIKLVKGDNLSFVWRGRS